MPGMTVIWTALPNGLTGDAANRRLRLSAYVSMRLTTDTGEDGSLATFPAALNWPSLLQPGAFSIAVGGNGVAATTANVISAPPDPVLWQDLFPATTRVASHKIDDLTGRPFNTYQAAAVHDQLRAGHQRLSAASPVTLPTRQQLQDALPDLHLAFGPGTGERLPAASAGNSAQIAELEGFHRLVARDLFRPSSGNSVHRNMSLLASTARQLAEATPAGTPIMVVPDDGTAEAQFKQLYAFHHREPIDPNNPPPAPPPPADPATVLDFHQALTALAQYPQLLRSLGLVVDLEVPEASLPQSALSSGAGRVQITPSFSTAPSLTSFSPSTAYILDGDRIFTSASQNPGQPETIAGLINVALPNGYSLVQVDVDSMGLKTLNMAASNTLSTSADGNNTAGTPAPRGPGVSVTRTGHASILAQRFATALQNNQQLGATPPQPVTLFAEDVTRGFRFDVFDGKTGWQSLHARIGSYVFLSHSGGALTLNLTDEGLAQPAAAQRVDGSADAQAQLFVHDSLMQWKGWSLAAPHPGKTIGNTGPTNVTSQAVAGGIPLQVNFACAPGTLPRLRFHRHYQVRARAVDLAGNSISVAEADDVLNNLLPTLDRPLPVLPPNINDFTFRRFEPVLAPHLVARERFTEGESLARLAIRSNLGEGAGICATRLMALVAASRPQDRVIYTAANDRHAIPPKTAQLTAEMHEMFEASFGSGTSFSNTYNIARKEKGRLTDTSIIDTATGSTIPIPDTVGIDPITGNPVALPAIEFVVTGKDSNGPNGYAVHHEPQLQLPYLPDPLSHGATLCGLPGVEQGVSGVLDAQGNLAFVPSTLPPQNISALVSITQIDFGASWPNYLPFRLQLAEPSNPDGPTESPTWDAQNRVLTLHLAKAEQGTVRLSSFINANDLDVLGIWQWMLERNAAQGLPPPDAGDAQTAVAGCMWMLTPFIEINLVHAVQQPLLAPQIQSLITPRDFNATFAYIGSTVPVHGKSTARLDLQASWQESLDDLAQPGPIVRSVNAHVFDFTIHLPSDAAGAPTQTGMVPIGTYDAATDVVTFNALIGDPQGRTFLSRHEFGDTKHRTVTYQATATTRFREYFPPEITNDSAKITQTGTAVTVEVPSSARPAAPNVIYAIPMFEWTRTANSDGSQVRIRKGGGIRVYLGRPWFSSGNGEMLGVVLASGVDYPPDEAHRHFVTHWGNDPVMQTSPLVTAPQTTDFTLAIETPTSLTIDEAVDHPVAAAAHAVEFDPDRELWFCDLRVNPGPVYSPFIRLALARYQKNAIQDTELSRVIVADFVQLMPDRTVTVTPSGNPLAVQVRVDGLTYQATSWHPGDDDPSEDGPDVNPAPPLIQVNVEERIPGTTDAAGWRTSTESGIQVQIASAALAGDNTPSGTPLWTGEVSVPEANRFRVVVREFEHFLDDKIQQHRVFVRNPPGEGLPPGGHFEIRTFHPGAGRLIFAETIEL
jgi:hypothetical protein